MVPRTLLLLGGLSLVLGLAWLWQPAATAQTPPEKVLRHVVSFKFKATSSPADIQKIETAFAALPGKIDAIRAFEWGTDNSPEGKAKGFTHCFLITFADEKGRDEYLPHPAHQAFVQVVGPHVEDVFVIDYWAQ